MPIDLPSADRWGTSPALLDALRQAHALSHDASTMPCGGQGLDIRTHKLLGRMAALLPAGMVTLPSTPGVSTMPPAYTRDDGDLRAIRRAQPPDWRISHHPVPVMGGGTIWDAHLHAPDHSSHRFRALAMNTAALRALLGAWAGLLLEHHPAG